LELEKRSVHLRGIKSAGGLLGLELFVW